MSVDVLAFLPAATLARVAPWAVMARAASGSTVHLLMGGPRPVCGRRPRGLQVLDVDGPPAVRVCTSCARRLPDVTRMHLATMGRPSPFELGALREAEVLRAAAECRDVLEHHRTEATIEGSVAQRVVFDGDPPGALDYNGVRGDRVPLTVGLMIGSLMPGAMTGGRLWLPGGPDGPARTTSPGGSAGGAVWEAFGLGPVGYQQQLHATARLPAAEATEPAEVRRLRRITDRRHTRRHGPIPIDQAGRP